MNNFLAFWHTFGPFTGPDGKVETPGDIIARKRREIGRNKGWTLWSFGHRTNAMQSWINQIGKAQPIRVFVLCSESPNALNPAEGREVPPAKFYREYDQEKWNPVPRTIKVPQLWPKSGLASAFVVSQILLPPTTEDDHVDCGVKGLSMYPMWQPTFTVKWFCVGRNGWQRRRPGARGEFLIGPGKGSQPGPIRALLELKKPYVVEISNK